LWRNGTILRFHTRARSHTRFWGRKQDGRWGQKTDTRVSDAVAPDISYFPSLQLVHVVVGRPRIWLAASNLCDLCVGMSNGLTNAKKKRATSLATCSRRLRYLQQESCRWVLGHSFSLLCLLIGFHREYHSRAPQQYKLKLCDFATIRLLQVPAVPHHGPHIHCTRPGGSGSRVARIGTCARRGIAASPAAAGRRGRPQQCARAWRRNCSPGKYRRGCEISPAAASGSSAGCCCRRCSSCSGQEG
jgi:hypothetical protein